MVRLAWWTDIENYVLYSATSSGWTDEEVHAYVARVSRQMRGQRCYGYYYHYFIRGRKPLNPRGPYLYVTAESVCPRHLGFPWRLPCPGFVVEHTLIYTIPPSQWARLQQPRVSVPMRGGSVSVARAKVARDRGSSTGGIRAIYATEVASAGHFPAVLVLTPIHLPSPHASSFLLVSPTLWDPSPGTPHFPNQYFADEDRRICT